MKIYANREGLEIHVNEEFFQYFKYVMDKRSRDKYKLVCESLRNEFEVLRGKMIHVDIAKGIDNVIYVLWFDVNPDGKIREMLEDENGYYIEV